MKTQTRTESNARYIVGAVGDWWLKNPPMFSRIDDAMSYYLSGKAHQLFCQKPIFIAREVKFKPLYADGKIAFQPQIDSPKGPFYHTLMYEGNDRGFSSHAHLTTEFKTLDDLIRNNPQCVASENIVLSQGLELEVKGGNK